MEREFLASDFGALSGTHEAEKADEIETRVTSKQRILLKRVSELPVATLDRAKALAETMALDDAELSRNAAAGSDFKVAPRGALVGGLIGWPADGEV